MSHDHDDHRDDHDHRDTPAPDWRDNGVKVIRGDQLDVNTAQTPGMDRAVAINAARVGAQKIWAGTVRIHPTRRPAPTTTVRSKA